MHPTDLPEIRDALMRLHKTLVDSERVRYEQTIGAIHSPGHFLQLLTRDPWFAWLQPLSRLIVSLDESMEEKEKPAVATPESLINQARLLIVPAENSPGFPGHYFESLQNDPDVVLAHAEVVKLIGRGRTR